MTPLQCTLILYSVHSYCTVYTHTVQCTLILYSVHSYCTPLQGPGEEPPVQHALLPRQPVLHQPGGGAVQDGPGGVRPSGAAQVFQVQIIIMSTHVIMSSHIYIIFSRSRSFHERPDSSYLYLVRQCPYLHTLVSESGRSS